MEDDATVSREVASDSTTLSSVAVERTFVCLGRVVFLHYRLIVREYKRGQSPKNLLVEDKKHSGFVKILKFRKGRMSHLIV